MNNNDFFAVDRLVEFGMGMAMAQQMVQVMNKSMNQMYIPGSMQSMPAPQPQSQAFYVAMNGQSVGPLSESDFSRLVTEKKVNKDTLAWLPGMQAWQPIEKIPSILRIIALTPPPVPQKI